MVGVGAQDPDSAGRSDNVSLSARTLSGEGRARGAGGGIPAVPHRGRV